MIAASPGDDPKKGKTPAATWASHETIIVILITRAQGPSKGKTLADFDSIVSMLVRQMTVNTKGGK